MGAKPLGCPVEFCYFDGQVVAETVQAVLVYGLFDGVGNK